MQNKMRLCAQSSQVQQVQQLSRKQQASQAALLDFLSISVWVGVEPLLSILEGIKDLLLKQVCVKLQLYVLVACNASRISCCEC